MESNVSPQLFSVSAESLALELERLCDEEVDGYSRLGARLCQSGAPLLVIVHPGDMTEVDASDLFKAYSEDKQDALADVIRVWNGDVAILHRYSSLEFVERSSRATESLTAELESLFQKAVLICYGDDLAAFAQDLRGFAVCRPAVVVTGAFKDEKHGCVDEVARRLNEFTANVSIHWSAYERPDDRLGGEN